MLLKRHHLPALACPLATLLALTAAAPALATEVAVSDARLLIGDTGSLPNAIEVRPSLTGYDVFDGRTLLTPSGGCVQIDPHRVGCPGPIAAVEIDSGGGDDIVDLSAVPVPAVVRGGDGSDLIEGGDGDDRLDGGRGEDTIRGNGGRDSITGAEGDDALQGDDGADRITGGRGDDIVQGQGGGGDVLSGDEGRDLIDGGDGNDTMKGGSGADVLVTGKGTDAVDTGLGADRVFGTPADRVSCSSRDEVSRGSQAPPGGCGGLAPNESEPDIWPPPLDTRSAPDPRLTGSAPINDGDLSAQAARLGPRLPKGEVRAVVLQQGEARKIKLRIPSRYDMPIRVRISVYRKDGSRLKSFRQDVRAKRWVSIETPGRLVAGWRATARCCVR